VLAAFFTPRDAIAGTTGAITGTVKEWRNLPLAASIVTVTSPSQREQTVTDRQGNFTFLSLVLGTYVVSLAHIGYGQVVYRNVTVDADTSVRLTVMLSNRDGWRGALRVWQNAGLVRPGETADAYVIPSDWPFYDVNGNGIHALRFVPALTMGAASVVSR
jgi:Carboxypeptidase regulatory-like domain